MILALLLTLRLILFDFHLLSKFGVLEPPPASQSHAKPSFVEPPWYSFGTESNSGTESTSAQPASQSHAESSFVEPHSFGTESNSGTTDAAAMCTALLQPMQRVLCASRAHPELNLTDLLRNEIICSANSSTSPCPVFHPNISKFAGLEDPESKQKWAKQSQNEVQRQISLRMWQSKRMDIAAARVLGCAVADGHEFTSSFENPNNMLHSNGMCYLHQQIHVLLPLVVFSVRGQVVNRTQYVAPFPQCVFVTSCAGTCTTPAATNGTDRLATTRCSSATAVSRTRRPRSRLNTGCSFASERWRGGRRSARALNLSPVRGMPAPPSRHLLSQRITTMACSSASMCPNR